MKRTKLIASLLIVLMLLAACTASTPPAGGGAPAPADPAPAAGGESSGSGGDINKFVVSICGIVLDDGINPTTKRAAEGWNTYAKKGLKEALPEFDITFNAVPWDNASGKVQALLMSQGTDLFTQGGAFIPEYYKDGLSQSLTPFLEADTAFVYEDIYPATFKQSQNCTDYAGEQLLTLPWQVGYRVVMYDKLLFDQWGVEYLAEYPTPAEVLEKAEKMTGKNPVTGEQNYGLWMSAASLNMSYVIGLSEAFGATEVSGRFDQPKDFKWSLNSPEYVKTVQWVVDAMKYAPAAAATGQGIETWASETNDVAIVIDSNGSKVMNEVRNTGKTDMLDRFEPTMNFGNNGGTWVPVDGMGMAAHLSKEKGQNAWEIIKFICGDTTQKWNFDNYGPFAVPNIAAAGFYDPQDKFLAMNSRIILEATHPGYEINPFYGATMQPTLAAMFSNSIAGNKVDVQAELDALQKKAEEWSASK